MQPHLPLPLFSCFGSAWYLDSSNAGRFRDVSAIYMNKEVQSIVKLKYSKAQELNSQESIILVKE